MATKKQPQANKAKTVRKPQTVRERIAKGPSVSKKRARKTVSKVSAPLKTVKKLHRIEYHLPLPDTKIGRILKKRVKLVPKFVLESFEEIKQVTWPNRRETISLTLAVFIFSILIASIVGVLDFGLSKAFEEFIVNRGK